MSKTTAAKKKSVKSEKRPRQTMLRCTQEDLNWDPVCRPQFTFVDGEQGDHPEAVRSGDSFAVVRPGHERWPLGHVSDVYKPASHRRTVDMILDGSGEKVEPFGSPLMSGHGYRVVHEFAVKKEGVKVVDDLPVTSRLTIVHDHSGLHALKARMVIYAGDDSLGSVVGARAIHVSENPERWRVEVDSMVERSRSAQDVLVDLLSAASRFALSEADKAQLKALGVKPAGKEWGATLLQSMILYHRGGARKAQTTFGVWQRRLADSAIVAMVKILGVKKYGVALDLALGGNRYGGKFTLDARKDQQKAA